MRNRMTRRNAAKNILAEIEEVERLLSAQDVGDAQDQALQQDADAIADEERTIVEESTDVTVKDEGDQNAKFQNNWPLTSSERTRIAKRLVYLARTLTQE